MVLHSRLESGIRFIRSVGDQEMEAGRRQMPAAIDIAWRRRENTAFASEEA